MFIDNYDNNSVGAIDEIKLPKINLANADPVVITFDLAHKNYPDAPTMIVCRFWFQQIAALLLKSILIKQEPLSPLRVLKQRIYKSCCIRLEKSKDRFDGASLASEILLLHSETSVIRK